MLNQEQCWEAVVAHDATQDGRFFYSVKTTGVYCRPGCASRQPKRENVAFHETTDQAEAAGFRPCKRCRPRDGEGETIRYTVVSTWLGWALVAATGRGICMTALGDNRASLEADLRRRFPAANLAAADAALSSWAERVVRFITRPGEQLDLPLDIRGTAFQAQVWRALQKIPPGETATYTGIAQALGRPRAVRAVAQACASNKLAVLVPCHRVVRRDGDLSGYRWGVERKRALLAREREAAMADAAAE